MNRRAVEDYYTEYLPRVMCNHIAKAVKIADRSHNISKAHLIPDPKEQATLRNKYAAALDILGTDPIEAEVLLVFLGSQEFTGRTKKEKGQADPPLLPFTRG